MKVLVEISGFQSKEELKALIDGIWGGITIMAGIGELPLKATGQYYGKTDTRIVEIGKSNKPEFLNIDPAQQINNKIEDMYRQDQ